MEKPDNAIEDRYIIYIDIYIYLYIYIDIYIRDIDIHVPLSVSLAGPRASAACCRVYLPYESQRALCGQANGLRHGPGQRG